ncbi:ABATE domain-containing protein [Kitasatospora sp. NPDC058965]|uniref:ABATE domain-containing protein n=1 Tax=Kitasatospora sp. NPDC058965 TaxID=3346682 RepID=UPI0036C5145C
MRGMNVTAPVPPAAPGADHHPALDFANTLLSLPTGRRDLLATPEEATAWLVERGLAPEDARLYELCAGRLRELRDQVRELLGASVAAAEPPAAALQAVNTALTTAPAAALLAWDDDRGLHREAAHPANRVVEHAMAVLAADAAELLTGPDAERLAQCGGTPCTRYLVRTHAARHWCSTRCGDRIRAARAYARRKQG